MPHVGSSTGRPLEVCDGSGEQYKQWYKRAVNTQQSADVSCDHVTLLAKGELRRGVRWPSP